MKRSILIAACAVALSCSAVPTYEPFTEYLGEIAIHSTNLIVTTSAGVAYPADSAISNCLDLATGGYVAPGGDVWGSLNFSGTGAGSLRGIDVAVITNATIFTQANLSSILPSTFPGYPSGNGISTIVENPAQPLVLRNTSYVVSNYVGNSAVLKFSQPVTRPTSGTKTLFVSYLFNLVQQGQLGTGNEGRYLAFLSSTNLAEGPGSGGAYATWASMFNSFNGTVHYASHGVLSQTAGSTFYMGGCDSSAGKNWSTTPLTGSYGTPVFVVGEYVLNSGANQDTNIVWVNPSTSLFGGATPPTDPAHRWSMAFPMSDLGGLCLIDRVGNGASGGLGTNYVANLIVGNTWSYVTGGPEFTNQSTATTSVKLGQTGSLTAAAVAAGQNVNYQWVKIVGGSPVNVVNGVGGAGGTATVSGANGPTLTLAGVSAGDVGDYQVVATASSTGYTLNSATATLLLADPLITASPASTTNNYGDTVNLTATVTTQNAPLSYCWYLGSTPLSNGTQADGSTISGATGTTGAGSSFNLTLTLNGISYQEAGSYTLFVTNAMGFSNGSVPATLAINDPYIVTPPANPSVSVGGTANFTVTAAGSPSLSYQWYENGTMLMDGGVTVTGTASVSGSTSSTLTLTGVSEADNGNYYCAVSSSASSQTTNSSAALLTVQSPLTVIMPPMRVVERAGDHVAFSVVVTGGGPQFQWSFEGAPISGATNSALSLANIQSANAGHYSVSVGNIVTPSQSYTNTLTVINSATLTMARTNLIVVRVGDGAQPLSGAKGNTLYLDQYTANGNYVNSSQIPDEPTGLPYGTGSTSSSLMPAGSPSLLVQGAGADAGYEAMLNLSGVNQQYLCLAAYCQSYPFAGTDVTSVNNNNNWRGLATVNAFGVYSLAYTNSGLYSGGAHFIRGMVTLDGTNFWTTGSAGSGTVKAVNSTVASYATGGGVPSSTGVSGAGGRVIQIVNGAIPGFSTGVSSNLVVSDAAGPSGNGLYAVTNTPVPNASGNVAFTPFLITSSTQPGDFAFSPDNQTIYIADAGAFTSTADQTGGGIQRWDWNNGVWTYAYTLAPLASSSSGAQGLVVDFSAATTWGPGVMGAKIYATTYGASSNSLVAIVDNGSSSTSTVLATAGPSQGFRGVRFGPAAISPSIAASPLSQTNFPGTNVTFSVAAGGSAPLFYQWYYGGAPIAGATQASFTTNNISAGSAGSYFVVVSNLTALSVTSSPAVLTVASSPIILRDLRSQVYAYEGFPMSLSVQASSSTPMTYQWQRNGLNMVDGPGVSGSQTATLTLSPVTFSDAASYQLFITNTLTTVPAQSTPAAVTVMSALGFNGLGDGWSSQGNISGLPGHTTPNVVVLTDGGKNEASSCFFSYPVYVAAFRASFTYQDVTTAGADGFAFVVQNDSRGAAVLGGIGGNLGYSGITNSAAVEFNIYANNTVGFLFQTNGVVTKPYSSSSPVDLSSGHPIDITIQYANGQISLTMTDAVAQVSFSTSTNLDLRATVGGDIAYVGFTGGSGGTVATQTVSNLVFVSLPTLSIQHGAGNSTIMSWPSGVGGYVLQQNTSLNSTGWTDVNAPVTTVGNTEQVTLPAGGSSYFYRLINRL